MTIKYDKQTDITATIDSVMKARFDTLKRGNEDIDTWLHRHEYWM